MSVPTYNESFAGIPIPDAVFDAFVRVVAIAVQGLQNRTPKRPLSLETINDCIHIRSWGYGREPIFSFHASDPTDPRRHHSAAFTWRSHIAISKGYFWNRVDPRVEAGRIALPARTFPKQKAVEEEVSLIFTAPYAVQRVSNESVAIAREQIAKVIRISELQ